MLGLPYTSRETRSGWTIGVGGEYAFTNFVSAFVEYNYYDFGSSAVPLTPLVPGLRPALVDIRESAGVVRAGVNLRFGR
jgi:outer membrane immunogenic protein